MTKKALLLGAGFSYDLGMPLAKGLTQDFFHFLKPERISKYMNIWKSANPFGNDRPIEPRVMDEVFDIYQQYYNNDESNYEEFLKEIRVRHNELGAKQDRRDTLHFVFGKFFDIISEMFWMYQVNNLGIYMMNKRFYDTFSNFLTKDELWVLSLNHDLFIEMICFDNKIPLSFGSVGKMALPISNNNFNDSINFGKISREDMQIDKMNFIQNNRGVNLIKLHGALNEFSYNNDKYVLHINPEANETSISYLNKVNQVLHEMCYFINGISVKGGSEIIVSDFKGEMQFLRSSILTGGYKYSETFDPKPSEEKISLMENVLSNVDEVSIIGYGFGDNHVNLRLYNAMLLNKDLSVYIIDPCRKETPNILKPFDYKMRVRRAQCGVPEWMSYLEKRQWDTKLSEELKKTRSLRKSWDDEYRNKFLSSKT